MSSGFHSPERPEDLPRPEVIWALGTLKAALCAGIGSFWPKGRRIEDDGALLMEDGGGNWWRMARVEGGRYLLIGWDRVGDTDDPFGRPVNLYADAPDWLPWEWITQLRRKEPIGFVYWWEDGAWARSVYHDQVDEDGLGIQLSDSVSLEKAAWDLADFLNEAFLSELDDEDFDDAEADDRFDDLVDRFRELAESAVGGETVDFGFLSSTPFGAAAATDVLRAAGIAGGGHLAAPLPVGTEKPFHLSRTRVLNGQEWSLLVEPVMRAATERTRPVPEETEPLRKLIDLLRGLAAEHGGAVTYTVACGERMSRPLLVDVEGKWINRAPGAFADFDLRHAEGHPEHGMWFFLRARATPDAVEVDRAYDHWPEWADSEFAIGGGVPIGDVAADMRRRAPEWRPEWVWLLDEEIVYDPPADPFVRPA